MKVEYVNGKSVDTDKLPDVDALLLEGSKELHALFVKYNRQLFLVGEMKSMEDKTASNGCVFFHVGNMNIEENPEEFKKAIGMYYGRLLWWNLIPKKNHDRFRLLAHTYIWKLSEIEERYLV